MQASGIGVRGQGFRVCSGSEAGSHLRLIDFVYHSTLGLNLSRGNGILSSSDPMLGLNGSGVSDVAAILSATPCGRAYGVRLGLMA